MNSEKKGVSPVIATVLLIGMVIVLGLIVFLWFRGMTEETITKFGGKNIKLVCEDIDFQVSYSDGILYVSNIGNVPVYGLNLKMSGQGGYETQNIKDLEGEWPSTGLGQGSTFSTDKISAGSYESITILPILIGTSDKGKKTYVCEEQYGYMINL